MADLVIPYIWPVVPLSPGQILDVRPEDVLDKGHFRLCSTYRGGGGYDQFPAIAECRGLGAGHNRQFVVQLHGCHLDCPYCYVTRAGVWGKPVSYSTPDLVDAFNRTPADVFHLMGGAPALYIEHWPELIKELEWRGKSGWLFHSDLLLTEKMYTPEVLKLIAHPRTLYAVSVKGLSQMEHYKNTRKPWHNLRFRVNLERLEKHGVPYYFTFTNCDPVLIHTFWNSFERNYGSVACAVRKEDSFSISIIDYDAMPHVDDVPWGGKKE